MRRIKLTDLQQEILTLVASGMTFEEIAGQIGVTKRMVDYYISTAKKKIKNCDSINMLLFKCIKRNLLDSSKISFKNVTMLNKELSKKENEVVKLFLNGYSGTQAAAEMEISENTIKNHLQNIKNKLGFSGSGIGVCYYKKRLDEFYGK